MKKSLKTALIITGALAAPVLISPGPSFDPSYSTVVESSDGNLLGARIADDGQWRFRGNGSVPDKFEKSLLTFEDKWFYYHPGINPVALFRAARLNIKARTVVSGGSTITMQVARISRGNRERTYPEKIVEIFSALKLELFHPKKKILLLYTDNAPFGGNTIGLEAASWRYTGKSSADLTWAEAAALAILPNSPSLVFPGKNQDILKRKRDALLHKLYERKFFDLLTLELALDEPVLQEPRALPTLAPHLTDYYFLHDRGRNVKTTIKRNLQEQAAAILNRHQKDLAGNFIYNSACLIADVKTGQVLVYVGNSSIEEVSKHGENVDIIRAPRSTGSILKPLLYAAMQKSGAILPNTLIPDIPTRFPGFSPKNFDLTYSGAVPAAMALSQSLNIPAVKLLQQFNPEKFLQLLKNVGFTSFSKPADHYGLSLILGGGETSLWELTGVYASLSRVLNRFESENKYAKEDYHQLCLTESPDSTLKLTEDKDPPLSAASIWLTYQALLKVNRPETESGWQYFESVPNLAWKTGTSFGFRDAWAVGTTPGYVIGVWVGNASGEGRPGLTGVTAAAPVLFDLVNMMGTSNWFREPLSGLVSIKTCRQSGYRAGPDCTDTEDILSAEEGLRSDVCPYHQIIHLNKQGTLQVNSDCVAADEIRNESRFVLSPAMEYFYRKKHPEYIPLPPLAKDCKPDKPVLSMEFIYPVNSVKIFIPRDQTGMQTKVIAEIAHRNPSLKIFWHLDQQFIGSTRYIHQMEIFANKGPHVLTAVDEDGSSISCRFEII